MSFATTQDIAHLVDGLDFSQKVERSLELIRQAREKHGPGLAVSYSGGKDSAVVWHLAQRVDSRITVFAVVTRHKPPATLEFIRRSLDSYPSMRLYENEGAVPDRLFDTDPDECCRLLKVEPLERALRDLEATCWATGLRCTEGHTRTDLRELEVRKDGLVKLNPILLWHEREVWQYLALESVPVNPLYAQGYRSLGCEPCTAIARGPHERAGRWIGTGKSGGECGLHRPPSNTAAKGDPT